jgi:D-tyrosyl-tRNA(Tyr) deacylase
MKLLIQKVKNLKIEEKEVDKPASPSPASRPVSRQGGQSGQGGLGGGFLIYVGIEKGDENKNLKEIVDYLENLQIVDKEGKFSQKIKDIKPRLVFISNITLLANFKKTSLASRRARRARRGRINFNQALEPNKAKEIFNNFIKIWQDLGYEVFYKEFGSFLEISSTNMGPINFILEL